MPDLRDRLAAIAHKGRCRRVMVCLGPERSDYDAADALLATATVLHDMPDGAVLAVRWEAGE